MAAQSERYRELWSAGERLSTADQADDFFTSLEQAVADADVSPSDAAALKVHRACGT